MADEKATDESDQTTPREHEFLQLFTRSQRSLHAYILAYVHDPNTAADLLQETNIVLWQKFDQFESGTNFFAWAREIARLSVIRHRRTSARRIGTLDPHLLEELAFRASELASTNIDDREILKVCLRKLKEKDRELISARYRPGASVGKMAILLGRTENSVSQSLCRIRRSLAECVERSLRAQQSVSPA